MPLLRADDDAARLRCPWLGPDESIRWPVDWIIQEWVVFAVAIAVAWVMAFPVIWSLWGLLGAVKLEQVGLTLLIAGPIGPGAGWLAKEQVSPIINSDRRLSWLAAGWAATARQLWWAHGPADMPMLVGAGVAWAVSLPLAARLPGPLVFWLVLSAVGCLQGARWVRDRVESPDRHRERTWARLDRSTSPVACTTAVTVDVPVRLDRCIPHDRFTLALRLRFIADLLPKGSK